MNAGLDQGRGEVGKAISYYYTPGIKIIKVWTNLIVRVARKRIDAEAILTKTDWIYVNEGMRKQLKCLKLGLEINDIINRNRGINEKSRLGEEW